MMDDFVSESDSDYTSYWRDWVSAERQAMGYLRSKGISMRLEAEIAGFGLRRGHWRAVECPRNSLGGRPLDQRRITC